MPVSNKKQEYIKRKQIKLFDVFWVRVYRFDFASGCRPQARLMSRFQFSACLSNCLASIVLILIPILLYVFFFYSRIDKNREKQWRHGHGRGGCFDSGGCVGISLFERRVTAASCRCSAKDKQSARRDHHVFSGEVLIMIWVEANRSGWIAVQASHGGCRSTALTCPFAHRAKEQANVLTKVTTSIYSFVSKRRWNLELFLSFHGTRLPTQCNRVMAFQPQCQCTVIL